MKTFRVFSMVAVALMMASCSNEDIATQPQAPAQARTIPFSATLAAPGAGAQTRTIFTPNGKTINVAWKEGDKVAIYQNGSTIDEVTVGAPDADGKATISGDITNCSGGEVTVVYPASAATEEEFLDKFQAQDGTLDYIADNLDFRFKEVNLIVSDEKAWLEEDVKLESQIAIWKLTLDKPVTEVSIEDEEDKENVSKLAKATVSEPKSTFYLALYDLANPFKALTIKASDGSNNYFFSPSNTVTLTPGKFYQSNVTLLFKDIYGDRGKPYGTPLDY